MSSFHPTHTTSTQSPEEILKQYPNASYIIVNDHHHNKITRPATNMARPTTDILYAPLSRLSVTPEELEEMRQRSASPSRYKGHSYPIDAIPPTRRLWRCLSGCRLPRGYVVQRAILAACLFTTLITWSGLLRNGHQKISKYIISNLTNECYDRVLRYCHQWVFFNRYLKIERYPRGVKYLKNAWNW